MSKLLALTLVLSTFDAFAAEIYIPAFPAIAAKLHVAHSLTQYPFTIYLLGSLVTTLFISILLLFNRRRMIAVTIRMRLKCI